MKKPMVTALSMAMALSLLTGCGSKATAAPETPVETPVETITEPMETPVVKDKGKLMMATTTSTADTGLLDYLAPLFKEATGYTLEWTAVGTGEALKMGEDGQVDVVLVHAKASEEKFVADGFGVKRFPVMYNDYVLVGPKDGIDHSDDIGKAFTKITEEKLPFINRGDDSGTDKKEKGIWKTLGVDPKVNPNYIESGQGMGATLSMADEKKAYTLSDRGTYLKLKNDATLGLELEVVCEGAKDLLNQYGVIAVSPVKYPKVNNEGANAFIEWICAEKTQKAIGEFGVKDYGQALFTPNADK